jgi:hypothetical protein
MTLGDEREISGTQALRRLILMTQSACSTLLQACTGIRAHELIGLSLDHDPTLQHGVIKSVTSLDGLMEVFSICGISAKRKRLAMSGQPDCVRWVQSTCRSF